METTDHDLGAGRDDGLIADREERVEPDTCSPRVSQRPLPSSKQLHPPKAPILFSSGLPSAIFFSRAQSWSRSTSPSFRTIMLEILWVLSEGSELEG